MDNTVRWLLEKGNPAIQYRTRTELLGQNVSSAEAREWILSRLPADWTSTKGLWYRYYITALAECGLKYADCPDNCIDRALSELQNDFGCSCSDFMLISALIRLGLGEQEAVRHILSRLPGYQLPDGGFVCFRQQDKLDHTPKGCYKACLHALMLTANCHKAGIETPFAAPLIDYFLRRNLFFRTDSIDTLVLDAREGWRSIDVFHPYEVMRVGIHTILESFTALGLGNAKPVREGFALLNRQRDPEGRVLLAGTLTKSYLPKERIGHPSPWATFYVLLAEKELSP